MNEKQMMIDMKHNIIEEDGEHKIPCNGDSTKGFMRPSNAEDGFCLFSETLITKIIAEKTLSETLVKEFTPFRSPIWAFKGEELKQQFSGSEHLRMLCVSWNMHGHLPQNYISELLNARESSHHLIVVATQECQRTISFSLFYENKARWESSLSYSLGNKYSIVSSVTMNALHLVIFSHESINRYISAISTDIKATGVVNMVGDKGGIGISLEISDSSFLFMNSHFASGHENNEQRNMDYFKISSSLDLPKYYHNQTEQLLKRFDFVIWMGDFNYRIQASCKNEVDQLINQKQFFHLLLKDQLLEQKKLGHVFQDFQEGLILFPPTYKMLSDVNTYPDGADTRIPGWTDRIFFKQKVPDSLRLVNYEMAMNVLGSDHRPVFAQFMIQTKINPKFQPIKVAKKGSDCVIF